MSTETLEGLNIFVHVTVGLVIPEHHPPVDGPGRDGDLLTLVVCRAEAREGAAVPQSQHVCVIPVLPIRRPEVEGPHGAAGDVETPASRAGAAVVEDGAEMVRDLFTSSGSLVCINLLIGLIL